MDAVVQFIRNGSCCMKDLQLFKDTFLYDPSKTAYFFNFPPPLNETTPLEALNSLCQFYAFVVLTLAGIHITMDSGWGKLRRINKLIRLRSIKETSLADTIVNQSLRQEQSKARRSIVVGVCTLSFGIAFFWNFAHCWHVTYTDWLGGMPGLMLAFDVFEVAFVPFLWYYLVDAREMLQKSDHMKSFAALLKQSKGKLVPEVIDCETFSWMVPEGWTPFWSSGVSLFEPAAEDILEQKRLNSEVTAVKVSLEALLSSSSDANKKKLMINEAANRLESDASVVRMTGYLEYLHFVLNFIAFYGFLMGCLAYYFDNDEVQPGYIRNMKLGLSNRDAEWRGYFFGELMWTIQPIVTLSTPMLLRRLKQTGAKVKSD